MTKEMFGIDRDNMLFHLIRGYGMCELLKKTSLSTEDCCIFYLNKDWDILRRRNVACLKFYRLFPVVFMITLVVWKKMGK